MDELIELVLEIIFEGMVFIGENKKISKWIRYPVMIIVLLLVLVINGLCFFLGFMILTEKNMVFRLLGIVLIGCGLVFLFNLIKRIKKYCDNEKNDINKINNN